MKRIYPVLIGLFCCILASAQKPVVVIDYFTSPSSCSKSGVSSIRNQVISGLTETNRVNLIDVEAESSLRLEASRRSTEQALHDNTARMGIMKTLGANYIITGVVSKVSADKKVTQHGVTYYTGNVVFSLKVMRVEDGTLVGSETYSNSGITGGMGSSADDAILATIQKANRYMKVFVSKYFKIIGTIVEMGEMKGGKAKSCYVSLGSDAGAHKGQKFEVYEIKTIAGRETTHLVGMVAVEEVVAPDLSNCKFVSGAGDILAAFQAGRELRIQTKEKSDVSGAIRNIL